MINLGDEVKDPFSGFTGIAMSAHEYLNGCRRISVQPKVDKEGKLPEMQTFDEPQLRLVKPNVSASVTPREKRPGGPDKYPDTGRR